MCSSVRGPAMPPPLVTWPTSTTAGPASLAKRISRAAHSRTCPTLPGAPSSSCVYVVWIESTKTTRALSAAAWCMIASSRVSPSTCTAPASSASRSARMRICSGDSSPDTYNVATPACSSRVAHCSNSVDFPMPGSPPTSTTDPGTMPPPNTKSNSLSPVGQRASAPLPTADRRTGGRAEASDALPARAPVRPTASSTRVFHVPHASQRPAHLGCSAPHSVQRNTERALDTDGLGRRLARRVVVEAGEFLLEIELLGAGGAVALLAEDHFGDALDALVGLGVDRAVVELLAIDETDDVGVLLDGARFAQVRELRPAVLAAALLRRARQLRQRHDRDVELLGQRLERARNVGNLLLAVLRIAGTLHQLQVIDDHEADVVLRLEAAGFGAHGEGCERGRVVDPDRRLAEQPRGACQARIVIVAQLTAPQPLRVHQPLGAEQPLHQGVLGHFQREDRDLYVVLDGCVLHHVERERRLPHGRPSGQDDEVGALESRREAVQVGEAAGDARHGAGAGLELLDALHRGPDQLLDAGELLGAPELRHLKDPVLGIIEHFTRGGVTFIDVLDDAGRGFYQAPQHGLIAHDACVILDVGGSGDDVDERGDVLDAAGAVEVAAARQLVAQGDGVDHVAALGQGDHRAEQETVSLAIEHRIVEELRGFQGGVLIEQHGAEDSLLGLVAPGGLAAGELALSRRGCGGRCGRHPRSVSSSSGCAAARPGDT